MPSARLLLSITPARTLFETAGRIAAVPPVIVNVPALDVPLILNKSRVTTLPVRVYFTVPVYTDVNPVEEPV
jgi:hypothetical protein